MMSKIIAVSLVAGLASPAAASTLLDFTRGDIGTGSLTGTVAGTTYTISGSGGDLTDATHKNNNGCATGYTFACASVGNKYDVGFGIKGTNDNEIDGINDEEYVQVKFDRLVNVHGFAGMLTYNGSQQGEGTEQVKLSYSNDGGTTWLSLLGITQNDDADPGSTNDTFGTVGLSYLSGLSIEANLVRFSAFGTGKFDDGNANVTAAALKVSAVPVPAGFPLLLAGIGALGWAARRKKRKAA